MIRLFIIGGQNIKIKNAFYGNGFSSIFIYLGNSITIAVFTEVHLNFSILYIIGIKRLTWNTKEKKIINPRKKSSNHLNH